MLRDEACLTLGLTLRQNYFQQHGRHQYFLNRFPGVFRRGTFSMSVTLLRRQLRALIGGDI